MGSKDGKEGEETERSKQRAEAREGKINDKVKGTRQTLSINYLMIIHILYFVVYKCHV